MGFNDVDEMKKNVYTEKLIYRKINNIKKTKNYMKFIRKTLFGHAGKKF